MSGKWNSHQLLALKFARCPHLLAPTLVTLPSIAAILFLLSCIPVFLIIRSMIVQHLLAQPPFITKDGSTIRSILDRTNAPIQNQSLAEARLPAGGRTERHYHKIAEELYFILEGAGEMELDGERRIVGPGDAILIPPGAWHTIMATEPLRFLCCCAPPYAHADTYFE